MAKQEPKGVYSIRLTEAQLKHVDDFIASWHSLHYGGPGFSVRDPQRGTGPVLSRAQVIRWALDEGLMVLDGKVRAEKRKKGGAK